MITDIKKGEEMVSVLKQVLQGLIWNSELAVADMGRGEEVVATQCRKLLRCIGEEPTDDEISFDEFDNVEFVNFWKRV
jgi:hypothetical protein